MKKLIVLFGLFICCAMSALACNCSNELWVNGQWVPVYGTGEWQQGEAFEMEINNTTPPYKVRVRYCYRITDQGQRQICLEPLGYIFDSNMTEAQRKEYLLLIDKQQRMFLDLAVYQIIWGKDAFTLNLPTDLGKCPDVKNSFFEVFQSNCATVEWVYDKMFGHYYRRPCSANSWCQYQYNYCWKIVNGKIEVSQTRKVIYNRTDCNEKIEDDNGNTFKCWSKDCFKDLRVLFPVPRIEDIEHKQIDDVFYPIGLD